MAPIVPVKSLDEAIELANSTRFGLGANVYTRDLGNVVRCMREIKAGTVWFNDPLTDNDAGPFGGFKQSGLGRELGREGLEAFQETKHVHIETEIAPKEWWYPYGGTGGPESSARESPLATTGSPLQGEARRLRNYTGGEWVEPSCEWLDDTNPATGELVGLVPLSGPADVDLAVAAARAAQPEWRAVAAAAPGPGGDGASRGALGATVTRSPPSSRRTWERPSTTRAARC